MLTITAKCTLLPGVKEEFMEAIQPLIAGSRSEEGCVFYNLYVDTTNPDVLTFIERWKDQAAFDFHYTTPHFTTIRPLLRAFFTKDMEVDVYEQID